MSYVSVRSSGNRRLGAAAAVAGVLLSVCAGPALAAKECSAFAVTIGNQTFKPGPSGDLRITLPGQRVRGQVAHVRGKFVEFDVNLNTFSICLLYTSPSPRDRQK